MCDDNIRACYVSRAQLQELIAVSRDLDELGLVGHDAARGVLVGVPSLNGHALGLRRVVSCQAMPGMNGAPRGPQLGGLQGRRWAPACASRAMHAGTARARRRTPANAKRSRPTRALGSRLDSVQQAAQAALTAPRARALSAHRSNHPTRPAPRLPAVPITTTCLLHHTRPPARPPPP